MSNSVSREELINEEFDRIFYDRHGDRLCRRCWRLTETEVNLPESRKRADDQKYAEHPEEFGPKGSALAGTRDRIVDHTERGDGTRWCECGSELRDRFDTEVINDLAADRFDAESTRRNYLLASVGIDPAASEYSHIDVDAYEQVGEHVALGILDFADHIARNFCETAAFLRWSSPESSIPRFSTVSFMRHFRSILRCGERTKIRAALRLAFADAVLDGVADDLDLLDEAFYVGSRPPTPSPNDESDDSEANESTGSPYRSAWQ